MNEAAKKYLSEYLATIGSKGGKAGTGAAKVRKVTSKMARKAAHARWAKRKGKKAVVMGPAMCGKSGSDMGDMADEFAESLRRMGI